MKIMDSQPPNLPRNKDIFDTSLNLEETHFQDGFSEGYNEGLVSGKEEGREVGEELGFYRGCIDVWNATIGIEPNCFSSRIQKTIKQMEELIEKYPILDPENESVQEIMNALRLKFRAISATLSMKLEYEGYLESCGLKSTYMPSISGVVGNKRMLQLMLACCKVYISEGRNKTALELIEQSTKPYSGVAVVNKFQDEAYNRVGYIVVSKLAPNPAENFGPLRKALLAMVEQLFSP